MSDTTREFQFEKEICAEMAKVGWLHSRDDAGYDRPTAVYLPDLIAWLEASCPKQLKAVEDVYGPDAPAEIAKRIAKAVEGNPKGILGILDELKVVANGSQSLQLYQRKPVSGMNAEAVRLFAAQRYRVMQQVHYSVHNQKCIDLVLFVNGLPLVTLELKSSFKQTIKDAIEQYKKDRDPGKPGTNSNEPLLAFGQRALVHFAVDGEEVYMTTRLAGEKTKFLPFNKGRDLGAGNPPNPSGYPVSYLWEEVLTPAGLSELVDNFVKRTKVKKAGKDGVLRDDDQIVFPRYHQWDATRKLLGTARTEGVGNRYLVQHSAGSGKSNTIAWLAHGLSALRNAEDKAVFDGVIIVTDRRVLDDQLGGTVEGFATQAGEVLRVAEEEQARSQTLADALAGKKRIIIVTLQTFPFVISKLSDAALSGRKFAVIADEAHSSQSGSASSKLKQALGLAEAEKKAAGAGDGEGDEDETLDDILAAASTSRGAPKNVSFFAFTATPKAKTLQIFGRTPDPKRPASDKNKPESFHVYTMKQAIEEGFILDVLQNYTCYDVLCKIGTDEKGVEDREVDKKKGSVKVRRWIELHPTNIAQKCKIIVRHFLDNVKPMLNGEAKAMVVTSGRLDAVRFKQQMDNYLRENGIKGVGTIVAFSGEVNDPEVPGSKHTETSMNPALQGMDIRMAIKKPEFNMLIVANKFQTGYDEPLLCGMYVDKELSGVATVQTFSRLNRTYPGKERTYILDFRNKPESVQKDFDPYFKVATLEGVSDPNLLFELQSQLDGLHIYTLEEVRECAAAFIAQGKDSQARIIAAVKPGADRFREAIAAARAQKNEEGVRELEAFRKRATSYLSAYEFLAQVCTYGDSSLEQLYIYLKALSGMIKDDPLGMDADITGIKLIGVVAIPSPPVSIPLTGDGTLKPLIDVGSQSISAREKARIEEIIRRINELFDGSLTDDQKTLFTFGIVNTLAGDKDVLLQAKANDQGTFAEGDFKDKVLDAIATQVEGQKDMGRQILAKDKLNVYVKLLAELAHDRLRERADELGIKTA
jgi:type I restriction enzyme R subunit